MCLLEVYSTVSVVVCTQLVVSGDMCVYTTGDVYNCLVW